jgi:hypothetical protein
MAEYRAYVRDQHDAIVGRHDLEAAHDEAAIAQARQYVDGHDVEIWQEGRMVVRLHHKK